MSLFDVLTMIGGLCLFLFGMNIMGQALERRAGSSLRTLLSKITSNRIVGFLMGLGVTAVIQSSSATTVMVVGFVNSGLMTLKQAVGVIMGANVGTTITAWVLSLTGIGDGNIFIKLLKPTSFTPVLALIGVIYYMFCKSNKKKDTGMILLGFATLMFGMTTMSDAVEGLSKVEAFKQMFIMFKNPILGLLVGALLTAIIQSSSASVGILQALALATEGAVSNAAAVPIIMGNGIGTCVTALISSVGAKKEARRAAVVHLLFNIIGSAVWLTVYWILKEIFNPAILSQDATVLSIAIINTVFKSLCTALLLPMGDLLEALACRIIPDKEGEEEQKVVLDERLLATPPIALVECRNVAAKMAEISVRALKNGLLSLTQFTPELAESIERDETRCDNLEDVLGTYLVRLCSEQLNESDSEEATELLKVIGDFERISDHGANLLESAMELREKKLTLTEKAVQELEVLAAAVQDILDLTVKAFVDNDTVAAYDVEPLEQVIDVLKEKMRTRHILRMQQGECSIEAGFVWSDLLSNLERASDHCSNIAGCVIDTAQHTLNLHETLSNTRNNDPEYDRKYKEYVEKYALAQ
ncbi:MAG: Na/Pi cotransporter family protein [Clostridiales bacterium]|nr:Na/Pi cotransporter family protein [Clostridiales bacterium]